MTSALKPLMSYHLFPTVSTARRYATLYSRFSYLLGSEEALASLLRADAPRAFLYAISKFQPSDATTLRSAFARALRALTVAISDAVGPSQWGLRADTSAIRSEAKGALDYLLHVSPTPFTSMNDGSNFLLD
jgi:hypothetical protein